jgi:hydrogenase nickel incorporation protein HypA/HybF
MHELAVAQAIVEKVAETAAGRVIRRIVVEIGELSCVSGDAVSFSFDLVAQGTVAERALLDIRRVPGDTLNLKSIEVEEPHVQDLRLRQ